MNGKDIAGITLACVAMVGNVIFSRIYKNDKYPGAWWFILSFIMGLVTIILYFTLNNEISTRSDIILGVSSVSYILWVIYELFFVPYH